MIEKLGFKARFTPVEHQDPKEDSTTQSNLPGMTGKETVSLNLLGFIFIGRVISGKSMHKPIQLQANSKTYKSCDFSKQLVHDAVGIPARLPSNQLK
tara:strand:- start:45 stop:335 length:291 start_codon:yes stop_codon:yes gene_type:complete